MTKTLLHYAKSLLQAVIIFIFLSLIVDWVRKPDQPLQSAAQTITLTDGQTTSLQSFSQNRVAVVYFWGSWCGICSYTSPTIEKLHQDNIPTLGLALRSGSDNDIARHMQENNLSFPNVNDSDGLMAQKWNIAVTPTIIILKDGKMIHHTSGLSSYIGLKIRIYLANIFS